MESGHSEVIPAQKAPTGIQGFDEMSRGGLPRQRTSLVIGGPGSGKTIFALQMLVQGARQWGEPGIFVAFEENSRQIITNAASFGWDLPALERDKLFFLDARMTPDQISAGAFDLVGMLAAISAKVEEMGARRIAFDSIDVLLAMMDSDQTRRQEMYRLHDWLGRHDLTGLISTRSGAGSESPWVWQDFLQFMADCVVILGHDVTNRVSQRSLRLVKYRGSGFAENEAPMLIGPEGIEVAAPGAHHLDFAVFEERVSSGVQRLDAMLAGGYYRGSSVLVTGAPGTAKSTLAGVFLEATCKGGERALYVSFDEAGSEIVRNLASVNIRLAPHVESGLLKMHSARALARSADEHLLAISRLIQDFRPHCLVIDPLSALLKSGGNVAAHSVAQRLLYLTKSEGITALFTSLLQGSEPEVEATTLQVSTIADTWIQLSYVPQGGERNRALTIIKSRGTHHSDQVRELVLSDTGVTLADVYVEGGEVLMGTLRWQKELQSRHEAEALRLEVEQKRGDLLRAEADAEARIAMLKRELDARRSEMALLEKEVEERLKDRLEWRTGMGELRSADAGLSTDRGGET